jgi:hypothetical protein
VDKTQPLLFTLTLHTQTAMPYRVNLEAAKSESAHQIIHTNFTQQTVTFVALELTQLSSVH